MLVLVCYSVFNLFFCLSKVRITKFGIQETHAIKRPRHIDLHFLALQRIGNVARLTNLWQHLGRDPPFESLGL